MSSVGHCHLRDVAGDRREVELLVEEALRRVDDHPPAEGRGLGRGAEVDFAVDLDELGDVSDDLQVLS